MMRGKFITFEGCEGSGKSTKLKMLENELKTRGVSYLYTREPGGTPVSEQIRKVILDPENEEMTPACEALLYAAARVQLLHDVIGPALADGKLVVCDRYIDSSLAYQGEARGLGQEFIRQINAYAIENFLPDCTIFLDFPPERSFTRKHGADKNDRIEKESLEFHQRVYRGYLKIAETEPDRFFRVDASGTKQETFDKVMELLKRKKILE